MRAKSEAKITGIGHRNLIVKFMFLNYRPFFLEHHILDSFFQQSQGYLQLLLRCHGLISVDLRRVHYMSLEVRAVRAAEVGNKHCQIGSVHVTITIQIARAGIALVTVAASKVRCEES